MGVEDLPDDLTPCITRTTPDPISGGGFGDVWKCNYNADGLSAVVAVKAFRYPEQYNDSDRINRKISREIGILTILRHTNIVPLLGTATGFGRRSELRSLVTPWIPNGTLNAYLVSNHNNLTMLDRSRLLTDVSAGLQYLHSVYIMHGDITGANILIDEGGQAKLIDFGLSTIVRPLLGQSHLAVTSVSPGQIRYAAPELVLFQDVSDIPLEKTDIYSFGCVMLQILSGRHPWFEIQSDNHIVVMISQGRGPQRPSDHLTILDSDWDIIQKCLQFSPELRPSANKLLDFIMRRLPLSDSSQSFPVDAASCAIRLGHQRCPRALNRLSSALRSRFTQSGNIDDLDEGIQFSREAVSLCPEGHTGCDDYLNNLAVSLHYRFNHQGNPNDLDEGIALHEEVLRLRPVGHDSRDVLLNTLGLALVTRFNERGPRDDITRAISLYREALTLCPPGHPIRDTTLSNLATALKVRYDELDVSEDLYEAIDLYRESLRIMRLDHQERHVTLRNLSSVLCSRFKHTRKNEDVEEAINLCQKSLEALPSLHPDRYFSYMRLKDAYLSRYRVQLKPTDMSLAVENFRLASGHPTQGFPYRIQTALDWVAAAESHQHDSAFEAYQVCLELFDNHVMTRSSIIARHEAATAFRRAQSLPVDAASYVIRRGILPRAVELMEQGRGQQWSLLSRLRTPLDDLESTSPELARKVSELNKRLSGAQGSSGSTDRAATEYRGLTRQWESAVAEIRNLQGFSRFLLPPTYDDLQAAARHGPVIILIASQYSCGAIIVPTSGEPHHVPLSSISLVDLNNLKERFTGAIRNASRMKPTVPRSDLIVLLRIVWDEIMLPIVQVLKNVLKVKRCSRIWLCPTAAFTSIPLHAANPFLTHADRSKEPCLEDLYICSYTPTLSALVRSRQLMRKRVDPSFVAIGPGQPGAGKGKALLAVDSELELVRKLVPVTANRTTISGDAATRAGALEALEDNTWVHLACHGKQDPAQPYHSHFVMRDEHLTLLDIMERDIPRAEFAFLSASHTAVGDKETPDEVIHLAAGLQFSGFKSVVGTLWEIDDSVAKHVIEAFYKYMFHPKEEGVMDCTKAAWALNCATHAVKTKVPLEQRMVFVHIGV